MTEVFEWREAPVADFAVIGDPVAHSLSPRMHAAAYRALGLQKTYVAIHVLPGEVGQALDQLRDLGYQGLNVTVPHKAEVIPWLVDVEDLARKAQAVNTIDLQGKRGINTDVPGFLETLGDHRLAPPSRVLMLGAGGSARALGLAMEGKGYALSIYNRTRGRAEALVSDLDLRAEVVAEACAAGFDMIVNTTSASLSGESLPIDWSDVTEGALAYDLAYLSEGTTPFLAEARERGLRAVDGRELLVAQGAIAFEWWLHTPAPRGAMREAVE